MVTWIRFVVGLGVLRRVGFVVCCCEYGFGFVVVVC